MEEIQHKYVDVRGLKLHVAEIGTGPVVVFLHGFPEIWYSWRHQMVAAAKSGFWAIAPDYRGYGLSEQPAEPEKATFRDLVDDLLAILDSFEIAKVFLVGKDLGARPVYHFALLHPDRVSGVITLGVPFLLTGPEAFPSDQLPKGFYMQILVLASFEQSDSPDGYPDFHEPGRAEKDFGRFDIKTVVKNIYILFSGSDLPAAREDQEIMDLVDPSTPLPPWFTEEDLDIYASLYEKSGFRTPLQVPYRAYDWLIKYVDLSRAWLEDYGVTELKVAAPALLIMGEKDYALKFGNLAEYISGGVVKQYVPNLEVTYLPEGSHFVQEQFPDQVIAPLFSKYKEKALRWKNSKGKRSRREFDSLSLRLIRPAMVLTVLDDSLPGYNDNTSEIGALQIADPANQNKSTELFRTQERDRRKIAEDNFGIG
ncbi:hypothetical protein RJ639_027716 [Escallonia herrerae]|uniref:AB hydrolase-1 domain-containing protein n=1 Tax=Escallonia herrerae TaxID=1293975 RepID=A0AA89BK72_9ASTE|nr:hypothetical protein RJ639_027716 [Escallonia herrerae]